MVGTGLANVKHLNVFNPTGMSNLKSVNMRGFFMLVRDSLYHIVNESGLSKWYIWVIWEFKSVETGHASHFTGQVCQVTFIWRC